MLRREEYQQAIEQCERRREELRKVRDDLAGGATSKSISTAKQIEWLDEVIGLSEQHLEYLRSQLASVAP